MKLDETKCVPTDSPLGTKRRHASHTVWNGRVACAAHAWRRGGGVGVSLFFFVSEYFFRDFLFLLTVFFIRKFREIFSLFFFVTYRYPPTPPLYSFGRLYVGARPCLPSL